MDSVEKHTIKIRNCSGIPVIEVIGEMNAAAVQALERTITQLAAAGHYHIVINLLRFAATNARLFTRIKSAAQSVAKHYGAIDIVVNAGEIGKMMPIDRLARFIRFCSTENEAVARIKRLARRPEAAEPGCSAYVTEAK